MRRGIVVGVAATVGVRCRGVCIEVHSQAAVGRAVRGDGRSGRVVAVDNGEWLEVHCAERLVQSREIRGGVVCVDGLVLVVDRVVCRLRGDGESRRHTASGSTRANALEDCGVVGYWDVGRYVLSEESLKFVVELLGILRCTLGLVYAKGREVEVEGGGRLRLLRRLLVCVEYERLRAELEGIVGVF